MKALRSLLLLSFLPFLNLAQTRDPGPLTNQRVIQLVQSGVSADELLRVIQIAPAVTFSLTLVDADQLRRAGVSEETIKVMAARESGRPFVTDQLRRASVSEETIKMTAAESGRLLVTSHTRVVQAIAVVEHGFDVTYNGGSLPSLRPGSRLELYIDGVQIRFFARRNWYYGDTHETQLVTIPAGAITEINYGRDVHRRVGTAIAVSTFSFGLGALTVLSTSKKHFLGLTWADGDQRGGIAVQCDKGDYRGIMEAIEGITGKQVVDSADMSVKN
jgi:hypothetical protein